MKFTPIFLLFLASLTLSAQTELKGKILEKGSQKPLEFADIILMPEGSSDLTGILSNSRGEFKLEATSGKYKLQISYVGQLLFTKELTVAGENIDLGIIEVENSQELDEIIITSRKKLIEQKVDRLVFNVANSSRSSQGDVIEVLKVTPGVRVENDKINMIGKGNLQVMIDNKIIQLTGTDLIDFLRSLASENIQSIEVINNPPARYEAAGNSGLINVILIKAKNDSWNALVKGTYLQRTYPTWRYTGSFNLQKDKLGLSIRLAGNKQQVYLEEELWQNFPERRWETLTSIDIETEGYLAAADLSYQIRPNWEIGGQYYFNGTIVKVDVQPTTTVSDDETGEVTRYLQSNGFEPQHPRRHLVNLNSKLDLDSLGRKVFINLDYFYDFNRDRKEYEGISGIREPFSQQYFKSVNLNRRLVENYSAKLDVEYPLQWVKLDYGGKIAHTNSSNNISFFNSELRNEPIENKPLQMNDFTYKEGIQALYISVNRKFNEKWAAQFGLRMENTLIDATSTNLNLSRDENYHNFFPTFYLSYNASENSTLSLNYSRRIERPTFFDLNPNIYFQNPFLAREGNPFLDPAFIQNIELSHIYKNLVSKVYYSYENNLFAEIPLPSAGTNITRFTVQNFMDQHRVGLSESYTYNRIGWWSSNNNLNINYLRSEIVLEEQFSQTGFNATISTYNDFNLNAAKTFIAGFNYWYQFAGVDGIFETDDISSVGLSLQFLLLNKNLNITLQGNDIFRTAVVRKSTNVNGVYQELKNFYDTRQFLVTLTYKFGNQNIKSKTSETGNEEEKRRI